MRAPHFLLRRTSNSWLRNALAAAVAIGLGLFAAAVITSAHSTPAQAADPVVTIRGFAYEGTLTVAPGATVTVVNADAVSHTLTAVDNSFTTPVIPAGGSATFTAPMTPRAYAIKCMIHASMSGTLTVSANATPTPRPTVTPTPSPTPTAPKIMIMNFAYSGDLTVAPGALVTVINMDTVMHTLTANDNSFTTPVIPPGGTATFKAPTAPGTYAIHCNIHSFMSGTLTVSTRPTTTPTPTPTTAPPTTPPSAGPTVMIMNFTYSGDLTVAPGVTVTVINMDAVMHTLTAVDNSFTTPVIPAGGRATFVAPTALGAHPIKCMIHASMSGTLTVANKSSPSPTATPRPTATARPIS